ncbi:hypothetical protein [Mycolicibacterium austroafricanum]|uniref:hypothetical protein n=1 Tax=Mycolicibacterium austroafricanum TaxID=39687 RepID=UPI001CA36E04|nr:hypothetical protein [Mycolicibacterium austroafricanum]QZT58618.1 hypothetical protein JN084_08605 [Mycolicibacterium austroafricanum]
MEVHSTSYRGAVATWTSPGAEHIVLQYAPSHTMVFGYNNVDDVDAICEIEIGGRPGCSDLATSANPPLGRGPVIAAVRTVTTDEESRRQ